MTARGTGPAGAIDGALGLPKAHLPHHESDHVPGLAYKILADRECPGDLERLRMDAGVLADRRVGSGTADSARGRSSP